ncbi:MAG: molybdopterin-dependent oxidoreductase [Pseudomonadota bacterium]
MSGALNQKRTFCRVCEPACGLIATTRDDELITLKADPEHPVSRGFVCNKGIYGKDIHADPDRLRYPMRRNAQGVLERVSWEVALTGIAERLKSLTATYGTEALAAYTGNPTAFNSLFGPSYGSFMRQLGVATHFSSGTQDCSNKFAGSEAVFGTRTLHPVPDIDHSDLIVLIGENPAVSHMSFVSLAHPLARLKAASARGARVVHVNPRRTETARAVGEHQPIRPDTDVYLLAAMLQVIDSERGFHDDASRHGRGVEELRAFLKDYPPASVAGVTGIAAETIRQLALDFADAGSACVHMSTGVNMGRQGTLAYWLLHMLALVTGNLGRTGGNVYSLGFYARSPAAGRKAPKNMLQTPFGPLRAPGGVGINLPGNLLPDYIEGVTKTAVGTTGSAALPPLRALFVSSGNPALSIAGESRMRRALKSLELLVCIDIYPNATSEHADYLLPAAGAFEREDINLTGLGLQYEPSVQFTEAVVSPGYERRPDWWIFEKLAQLLGFDHALPKEAGFELPDPETTAAQWGRVDAMLRSRGQSFEALRSAGILTFERSEPESLFSEHLQQDDQRVDCFPEIFDDMRTRMASLLTELEQENPEQLKLISKRDAYMFNSWYSNLPKLRQHGRDHNPCFMHPEDAARRQISEGDAVTLRNANGTINARVALSEDLMPGVVAMSHGWGHGTSEGLSTARANPGSNCNELLPSGPGSFEPISNQAHMTGIPIDVTRTASPP